MQTKISELQESMSCKLKQANLEGEKKHTNVISLRTFAEIKLEPKKKWSMYVNPRMYMIMLMSRYIYIH